MLRKADSYEGRKIVGVLGYLSFRSQEVRWTMERSSSG